MGGGGGARRGPGFPHQVSCLAARTRSQEGKPMGTQTPRGRTIPLRGPRYLVFGLTQYFLRPSSHVPGTHSPHNPEVAGVGLNVQMENLRHRE